MDLEKIVASMSSRMPWDVGQIALAVAGIAKGHGWDRTVQKHKGSKGTPDQLKIATEQLKQHLLCGEKLTRIYELTPTGMAKLREAVKSLQVPTSKFAAAYPLLLAEQDILADFPQPHTLTAVEKNDDGVAVVFASSRAILLREQLDKSELSEDAAKALAAYDQVVGVKLARLEALDVVWVPHTGNFVDVRVDFPKGMHHDVGAVAHEKTIEALSKVVGFQALATPLNLFPLIDRLYQMPKEGTVVELAFGTTTASLKHERMRRSGACLREEKYHQGGKLALQSPIEPYRLSVQWTVPIGPEKFSRPELSLHGSSRVAMSDAPYLDHAVVRHCVGLADYNFVLARLEKALEVEI